MNKLDAVHDLVVRIDERTEYQGKRIDELHAEVFKGNGRPGLVERVGILERASTKAHANGRSRAIVKAAKWSVGGMVVAALISLAVLL